MKIRNFRLLWIGEGISLLGDQFYMIALPWLVLSLMGNALAVGTVFAAAGIPRALFMLVGGGNIPKPGEISLAHRGVLFLDEFPEFGTRVLEVMRQPMEDKVVTISRAKGSLTFSANFQLIAAMNPCPCGFYGDSQKPCTCAAPIVTKYQKRISGPL